MPLFVSDAELQEADNDISVIVQKADAYIRELQEQLETSKAQGDATAITAEQNCALLEQKYISLSAQFSQLENEKSQLTAVLDKRATELAQVQAQTHKLELGAIKKDSEVEHLSLEVNELHKSKRELLEVLEHKSTELTEKNNLIKNYLDKIVSLTDERSALQAKLHENEAELARSRTTQARLSQEKELTEKHNTWLNEELTSKVDTILQQRQTSAEIEADLSAKLADAESKGSESRAALQRSKEKVKELEEKLASTREELLFTKEDAAVKEEHLSAEVATACKLADLHKQSSEESRQKANELDGVIKALETHLNQVEADYKDKLQKEYSTREELAKESAELKEKLDKMQAEIEALKAQKDCDALALVNYSTDRNIDQLSNMDTDTMLELHRDGIVVPRIPPGISGTALAASLLRDGWSLAKIYTKYQEAVDAWRHERQACKQSQAILERVLHEIEEKAEVILDERAEHGRMIEAYIVMEQKLQQSMSDQGNLDNSILHLKADLRKREREYSIALKEIQDLQTQVTVLLKECRDIQLRFGISEGISNDDVIINAVPLAHDETAADKVISDRLLTFKDIHGMVEQNCQLRSLARTLAHQNEQREQELKEAFDFELKKRTNEAASKVAVILKKSEEQSSMIESLQGTVGMYKRLYEEEIRTRAFFQYPMEGSPGDGRNDLRKLVEISQETTQKTQEQSVEQIRCLKEDIKAAKHEANALRSERDRLHLEATYARERLNSFMRDSENQRNEMNGVLARNVEFSQMITEYQRRLRENSQSTQAAEERARRFSMEVSVLEHEKEILSNAEKRASEEVILLSDKVHRLQATLDTIQNVDEIRESSRQAERKRLEDDLNRLQREWVEAKKELQVERDHVRNLTLEREQTVKQAMSQVESMSKDLADALRAVSAAEARAIIAEARNSDLVADLRKVEDKASGKVMDTSSSVAEEEVIMELQKAREVIEHLKEDLQASNQHTEQFKYIAQANEDALRQIESAHEHFKTEAGKLKQSLESEVSALKKRISDLEVEVTEKEMAAASAMEEKEKVLINFSKEITAIADDNHLKTGQLEEAQICITALKADLEKEHQNWRTAQSNYERQVVLQGETIQELDKTSKTLATLQEEVLDLRKVAGTMKDEYESSKVSWEMEKASLQSSKVDTEKKYKEVDEQNKLLLDRLEAMHIKIAEKERNEMGITVHGQSVDDQSESDFQNVIHYLRRSKETADTEISLLKQERMRLQKQLESALRASETAQAALRKERENTRAAIYTDEEFSSLQCRVAETNLLRESNAQLRDENKRNFEECQELRDRLQNVQLEIEQLRKSVREKDIELDAAQKELEMQKMETGRWENRVSKLLEKHKTIDVEHYEHIKVELQQLQEKSEAMTTEVDSGRKLIAEKQKKISNLEEEVVSTEVKFSEMEKKLQEILQVEATLKSEAERHKKQLILQKRRVDSLTKEKDELNKERQALAKQIEEMRSSSGKKVVGELSKHQESVIRQEMTAQHEQALKDSENMLKERDTRIQILEKTLEREREELKRERVKRQKDQKSFVDVARRAVQEKKKYYDEYDRIKSLQGHSVEKSGSTSGEITALDEKAVSYFSAVDHLEEISNLVATDISTIRSSTMDAPPSFEAPIGAGDVFSCIPSTSGNTPNAVSIPSGKVNQTTGSTSAISLAAVSSAAPVTATTITAVRQIHRQALTTNPTSQHFTHGSGGITVVPSVKSTDEKDQRIQQYKTMLEEKEKSRKTSRKIIRPRIEPTNQQDSTVEADVSEMDADIAEDVKGGMSLEAETQGGVPLTISSASLGESITSLPSITVTVPVTSGIRKRVASTSLPDVQEESTEQGYKSELAPLQKKARGMDLQEELAEQSNPAFENIENASHMEITQEPEERDDVNEPEMKDGAKELSERVNGGTTNLEVEDPISKRPRIARVDDSKFEKQPLTDVKGSAEAKSAVQESNESENPLVSTEKVREVEETIQISGYQVAVDDSSEALEKHESPAQLEDVVEDSKMQQSNKLESSAMTFSSVEIPSGGDDICKQQDTGMLIVDSVNNADPSAPVVKESEVEAAQSIGLDTENDKNTVSNSSLEAVESGQISDVPPDTEEGEISVDMVEEGDIEDEDKREIHSEGLTQELGFPSEEIAEFPDQQDADLDQTSLQNPVNVSYAAASGQSSQEVPTINNSDTALDQHVLQVPAVNASDVVTIEDKCKGDMIVSSSESVEETARPATRNTTINLADRARERGRIRERERRVDMPSPSVSRGRGRIGRGTKRGGGSARGRGSTADDSQGK